MKERVFLAAVFAWLMPCSVALAAPPQLHVGDGGTGATTAGGARANLGLNYGLSVGSPGTSTLEALTPIQTATGQAHTYACGTDIFIKTRRSNGGSSMSDVLPSSSALCMVNGAQVLITNTDASASITLTAGSGTTINGNSTLTIGPGRDVWLAYDLANAAWRAQANSTSSLLSTNNLSEVASPSVARANLGAASSGANNDITSLGALTTPLSLPQGGVGASTAAGARANIGAAVSGANGDITSLSGLTTPLSAAQGGTGASSTSSARTNLGAAASGANSDITSIGGLTTPLSLLQGGVGASTSSGARANLGAAASGANSDITSLAGLSTPLSLLQGGVGASTASGARTNIGAAGLGDNNRFTGTNFISTSPPGTLGMPSGLSNPVAASVIVPSDNAVSVTTPGNHIPTAFDVEYYAGGSSINDGRNAFASYFELTAPTSASSTYRYYTSGNFFADIASNDNGTSGTPEGSVDGIGIVARLRGAATNWTSQLGVEINTAADTGSSVLIKAALGILPWPEDAVHGSLVDAGVWFSGGVGSVGYFNLIQVDATEGAFPISAGGTFAKIVGGSFANGIDMGSATLSGNFAVWGGSSQFYLNGSNGAASLGPASFAVNAASPVKLGVWSLGGYGMESFNSSLTSGAALGIAGGNTGDPNLYAVMPTGGSLVLRPNGATTNTLTIGDPGTTIKLASGSVTTGIDMGSTTISGNFAQWGGSSQYSLGGNGAASLGTASFAVNASSPVKIGLWGVAGYGMETFNSSFVSGSALGIAGGDTGDANLYAVMPANGYLVLRSNGATSNTLTIGDPSPGTATKFACGDSNNNLFFQSGSCI